jgi:hypothetical protein
MSTLLRKPAAWAVAVILLIGVGFGIYWTLDRSATGATAAPPSPSESVGPSATPGGQRVSLLAKGNFVSHEHKTTGEARLVQLYTDGHTQLVIVGLDTTAAPDLHLMLSAQRVTAGNKAAYDDGFHVDLGPLKAAKGDQTYEIPRGTDLTAIYSVTVWSTAKAVSFGAAELKQVPRT